MEDKNIEDRIKKLVKELGLIPLDLPNKTKDKILVVDVNFLLSEEKEFDKEDIKQQLESEYKMPIFLIDGSKINTQGMGGVNYKPVYII